MAPASYSVASRQKSQPSWYKMDDNIDDVIERMKMDELDDAPLLSPREFAKLIGVAPQLVYYYIRTKKIDVEICNCGRKTVNVEKARLFFDSRNQQVRKEPDA